MTQKSTSLTYEPSLELLLITAKQLFSNREPMSCLSICVFGGALPHRRDMRAFSWRSAPTLKGPREMRWNRWENRHPPKALWGGYLKSQFSTDLVIFGDTCPQNGSKTAPTAPRPHLGCPHKGPSVASQVRAFRMPPMLRDAPRQRSRVCLAGLGVHIRRSERHTWTT